MSSINTGQGVNRPVKIALMKTNTPAASQAQREFERLRLGLSQVGYLSQGSVQDRTGRAGGGAGYQWTRKVGGKTVTVALTAEQFTEMKRAVAIYRQVRLVLQKMERLSRCLIFQACPHPIRRKPLSSKVLGTN
jgi:4-hydroxy-3-methylbut-2-en-1-yl diphosphate synthase IspG/GcpE